MALDDIVSVSIQAQTATVSRTGFGTPLIAGFHANFANRVKSYASITELVADGFGANDPITRCATKIMAQNPRPPTFKVGRRALGNIQTVDLTPTDTTEGLVVSVVVISPDGTSTTVTHTNGAAETVAAIVASLQTQLTAITDLTATDIGPGTLVRCVADNAGELFDYKTRTGGLDIFDGTADPGIATDLAAIVLEDPDWYGLVLDSNSEAEIAAAATWVETQTAIFAANSADTDILDTGVTTDIASDLETAAHARTFLLYSGDLLSYAGAAWLGKQLPTDPGTTTWAFKTLTGVVVDTLNTTERSSVESKTANHYTQVAGRNITRTGITAANEFVDVTRYIDFLAARIQENVFALLVNLPKIPYTDAGVDLVLAEVRAQLRRGIASGALASTPEPTVTAPKVADVAAADRAARLLPDVEFTAQIAGAIHEIQIAGTLTA